jgi:predicted nucleic acid-binding protein
MTALVDTNVLVYRFDPRDPGKQKAARDLLREGIERDTLRIAHHAIVEFVQAVTRPLGRVKTSLLTREEALREAEELLLQFRVLYPTGSMVRTAIRRSLRIDSAGSTPICGRTPSTMGWTRSCRKIFPAGS